jgi:hypothetical protein
MDIAKGLNEAAEDFKNFGNYMKNSITGSPKAPDYSSGSLIHPSFPPMGTEQRAHEGSQSDTPIKGNP